MPSKTALITGASSGIGLEIAKELARHRYDVVLVARRQDKLRELAAMLEPHVGVKIIPADLTQREAPQQIFDALEGRPIDMLVNNAGFGDYGFFAESDLASNLDMMSVNIVALTHLTQLFLPGMIERKTGQILNVASVVAFYPGPLMSVYYASKAYVLSFSEALSNETAGSGVTVTCLCPGATTTEFQGRAGLAKSKLADANYMTAKKVAKRGVKATLRGDTLVIPGLNNQMLTFMPRFLPRGALAKIIRRIQELKTNP